jgi:orotidine-5'-phosphate decarboxylase
MKHNMQILQELATKYGPLCVGLDTDPSYIPTSVLKKFDSPAEAVLAYNKEIISRVQSAGAACCFKVQIAYYEAMGLAGMKVYAETLHLVKESGLLCISDIKRGDIANTASAYAKAHFSGEFETDIITVNPYMGFDTLKPFAEYCAPSAEKTRGAAKGMFVLLRTSNPGMVDIEQQVLTSNGGTQRVLDRVGTELERLSAEFKAQYVVAENEKLANKWCSPVGAVVGCTEESDARALRDAYPDIFFLIPGYGAQGGDARICATLLDKAGGTVNSSRGILCAWKKSPTCVEKDKEGTLTMDDLGDAAGCAAIEAKKDLLNAQKK